jgi:hypothetical protein
MTRLEPGSAYILLKFADLLPVLYPSVPLYLFLDNNRDFNQISRTNICEEM